MSDIALRVRDLGKCYRIGVREEGYKTLRDALVGAVSAPVRNLGRLRSLTKFGTDNGDSPADDIIWALKDVSFDVKQGEVMGVIGANGAGKSTLLKILSRITEPTTGAVQIKGRVSSLLEVGTGFHPELTGRENVYLNAAVLGMRKKEIERKFDEIVDFSGVERFIDTPVKRYSSGMQVRLAFAVAAHLEPEVLIVDEVLAVGDAAFQKKCLGKMGEVAKEGRTVLFVSHNLFAVSTLCSKALLLEKGNQVFLGDVQQAVEKYLHSGNVATGYADLESQTAHRTGPQNFAKLLSVETMDKSQETTTVFKMGSKLFVKIEFELSKIAEDMELVFYFINHRDIEFGVFSSRIEGFNGFKLGKQTIIVEISELYLMPGDYYIGVWINSKKQAQDDMVRKALKVEVLSDINLTETPVDYSRYRDYHVFTRSRWAAEDKPKLIVNHVEK